MTDELLTLRNTMQAQTHLKRNLEIKVDCEVCYGILKLLDLPIDAAGYCISKSTYDYH